MGEKLIEEGADILLPVAGEVGQGAAVAAREHGGISLIGVDSDWAVTYPEYADILLTSIEKRMDVSVVTAVGSIVDGTFSGGTYVGTLENGGVGIAPFHELEELVSDQTRAELEEIGAHISARRIKTLPE